MKRSVLVLPLFVVFVLAPALCLAQMTGSDRTTEGMGESMMQGKDLTNYSFERRDEVIEMLKDKKQNLDEKVSQAKQDEEQAQDMKKQQLAEIQDQKKEIDSMIKRVQGATQDNWQQVIEDVSEELQAETMM